MHEIMERLGDQYVDIIKMDIEGAEFEVIDSLIERGPLPTVLCVEFDQPVPVRRTVQAVRRLRAIGYKLLKIDGWNYSFAREIGV